MAWEAPPVLSTAETWTEASVSASGRQGRTHVEDAVDVEIEGDLDLRDTLGSGRDVAELELAVRTLSEGVGM
jgi:hypothetical protein